MGYSTWWKGWSPKKLNVAIQIFSLVSIFFEGYDQGVMGGVNSSPYYVTEVGIGEPDGTVTDTVHQGGIVSVYYLGCIFGSFAGGWAADRIGRINGLFIGCLFALVGGALQAAAQSSDFIIVARVITGIGTGALTGITPVMISETSTADHRGGYLGYVFIANYLGISVAYWISFGLAFVNNGYSDAREVLEHVRGRYDAEVEREFLEIRAVAEHSSPSSPLQFVKILVGRGSKPNENLGQRAWLCLFLQIMASWTGITAVTAYSPVLLSAAGYPTLTQNGLAGGLNTVGIIGTIISAQIVDRLGRRKCLMGGSVALFAVNLIAGAVYEASRNQPEKASQYAPAAVTMLFLFNICYAATWGTVAFLIPTEIWSSEMRAQGNGFGITGWAIGVGMTVLVNPIMFDVFENRTYFLFAGLNLLWIPVVFLFYPETANRSLESIDALFSANSFLNRNMEKNYREHSDVLAEHAQAAPAEAPKGVSSSDDGSNHGALADHAEKSAV
ncbi:unnamed protein product [Parascedosporium putredinis]|uniref:Major facilitator superfamily (MFS) profile domain-containing protein n=1 Tax=Parascedosporium putredinis TaxID=1442378 RepID=A0A9P1HCT8_9PEZI|nr:unnamed protein product [Parascedosporium putredinis]CAI8005000.1 unnamed protein product [Parascedosporium putredinis]